MTLTYQTCPKVGFKVIINESSKIEEIYLHGTDDEFAECKINIESLKKRIKDIKGGTIEQVGNKSEYYVYDKSGYQVGKDPFKSI
jgi:hypothetical protein